MGSLEKKIQKKRDREAEKQLKKDIKQKMNMFDKIPDECIACDKEFDKADKEAVASWSVVVREQEGKVNLYCPRCWDTAQRIIKEIHDAHKPAVE